MIDRIFLFCQNISLWTITTSIYNLIQIPFTRPSLISMWLIFMKRKLHFKMSYFYCFNTNCLKLKLFIHVHFPCLILVPFSRLFLIFNPPFKYHLYYSKYTCTLITLCSRNRDVILTSAEVWSVHYVYQYLYKVLTYTIVLDDKICSSAETISTKKYYYLFTYYSMFLVTTL